MLRFSCCEVEDVVCGTGEAIRWMECGYLFLFVFYRWVERQEQEHRAFDALSLCLSSGKKLTLLLYTFSIVCALRR